MHKLLYTLLYACFKAYHSTNRFRQGHSAKPIAQLSLGDASAQLLERALIEHEAESNTRSRRSLIASSEVSDVQEVLSSVAKVSASTKDLYAKKAVEHLQREQERRSAYVKTADAIDASVKIQRQLLQLFAMKSGIDISSLNV